MEVFGRLQLNIYMEGDALIVLELKEKLSALTTFSEENIEACIHTLSDTHQIPTGHYIHPLRFAVSGRSVGPSLYHMLPILGQSTVLARIQRCLDTQLS